MQGGLIALAPEGICSSDDGLLLLGGGDIFLSVGGSATTAEGSIGNKQSSTFLERSKKKVNVL